MRPAHTGPATIAVFAGTCGNPIQFWAKKLERTIVHSAPDARTAALPRRAAARLTLAADYQRRSLLHDAPPLGDQAARTLRFK
jgi:hypothetical protein